MINLKFEDKTVEIPAGFTCDKCGEYHFVDDHIEWQEKLSVHLIGGYGCVYGDGAHLEFDICQNCLLKLVESFARFTHYD